MQLRATPKFPAPFLRSETTGRVYPYCDNLAKRTDMKAFRPEPAPKAARKAAEPVLVDTTLAPPPSASGAAADVLNTAMAELPVAKKRGKPKAAEAPVASPESEALDLVLDDEFVRED